MLLALPACGSKTDEKARAAGILPVNALGMVSVNLSPSIEQKKNLLSIARQFPGAKSQVKGEFNDARDNLLSQMLEDSGLDYKKDVKPWLGSEAAVAFLPPGDSDAPLIVAMVQTDDNAKATAAIAKADKAGNFKGIYAIVDDFVVISDQDNKADNQKAIDAIKAQAKKSNGGLAKSAGFTSVVGQLHGDRLILGWLNAKEALSTFQGLGGGEGGGPFSALTSLGKDAETVAFDLHAEDKAVVFQGVTAASGPDNGATVELTRTLPAATLAAFTLFDISGGVTKALETVTGSAGAGAVSSLEESIGLSLNSDILSWMKGESVIVGSAPRDGQPVPDFAVVVTPSDKAKAAAGILKIRDAVAKSGITLKEQKIGDVTSYVVPEPFIPGVQPAMALFPDRFVLANSPAYLADLAKASKPGFGDSEGYTSAVGTDSKGTSAQFVALIDPIREALEKALLSSPEDKASYEKDVKPNLEPLKAFGFKQHRNGKFSIFQLKLTFD